MKRALPGLGHALRRLGVGILLLALVDAAFAQTRAQAPPSTLPPWVPDPVLTRPGSPPADARSMPCPAGQVAYRDGSGGPVRCIVAAPCAAGQSRDESGRCTCPVGTVAYRSGASERDVRCVATLPCPVDALHDRATGACVCPPGSVAFRDGTSAGAGRCVRTAP